MSRADGKAAPLRVGCWSFTATAEAAGNDAAVRRGIAAAGAAGVRVLLTPECALPGYPGAARPTLAGLDGCALAEREDALLRHAREHGIELVLGSAAEDGAGGWTNDAAAVGARYRKRCLTPGDTAHFVPGTRPAVITVDGWRCGLAICYDLRFPDVWADLHRQQVDALLVIAHMAGADPDPGTKAVVIPAFCAVRAAEAATPLVFCNTAAADRWLDSAVWDARGVRVAHDGSPAAGGSLLVADLQPRDGLAPWYAGVRDGYLARLAPR